jgi:hypothetical protein
MRFLLPACAVLLAACNRPAAEPSTASQPASGTVAATHAAPASVAQASDSIVVYKTPTCGCCKKWVEHLREHGFRVATVDQNDVSDVKARLGVPSSVTACHTATVGGYVVEGHVPASDIQRLLAERPAVEGIGVGGMPTGSPGMEGLYSERYEVKSFDKSGATKIFASH